MQDGADGVYSPMRSCSSLRGDACTACTFPRDKIPDMRGKLGVADMLTAES